MLKITVANDAPVENTSATDEARVVTIDKKPEGWLIGESLFDGDMVQIRENLYHLIWKNKSYNIEILGSNPADKSFRLLINGAEYFTTAKDRLDLLLEGMGLQNSDSKKVNNVKAPMPGLIQSVAVGEGDQVSKGDILLVLVAMKMENVIKSSGNGTIRSLKVAPGEIVEKNQVLMEFQ
ncbi:acetyl-CoA carboxylase biotin carboxyl carrier protein subunit [Dyadobacter aurulentus]|uniref:acetyl-CoA carboxylase biotin carboxyl carrier protein subunit n=1 Tax=Dyadobacter sp. UC 10 TaxID=2605428 RepID=UPI0011F2EE36|nr:acetyl-CoA carboxylase biotin carboxyl carrier protein subunit [Dyadobacter sp. UC 10]KAA0991401.1 acetyl-CoA carboxylase biotin carboxyl carrier protein subunit [Dyadobacter sp. UC 10]